MQSWLRDALAEPERSAEFVAALSFMYALPQKEVVAVLEQRTTAIRGLIELADDAIATATEAGVPEIFLSEEGYSQALRRAELAWLARFTDQLRSGELRWPRPQPTKERPA